MPDMDFDHRDISSVGALPSSADAARSLLPAARIAAREKFGRVRMMVISPILTILLTMFGELLISWLKKWLDTRERAASPHLAGLARKWEAESSDEVKAGVRRAARGETGE